MIRQPPQLDTVTLRPALSGTETIHPTNIYILRPFDPPGVGLSNHPQTAQFDPLKVGLSVGCGNPTHYLLRPAGRGQFWPLHTDGAVKKKALRRPRELRRLIGQPGASLT
jgi:hypothetical protein